MIGAFEKWVWRWNLLLLNFARIVGTKAMKTELRKTRTVDFVVTQIHNLWISSAGIWIAKLSLDSWPIFGQEIAQIFSAVASAESFFDILI